MIFHAFERCSFDHCVYYKLLRTDLYIYLLLYVDDILIACEQRDDIEALKLRLNLEFDMKHFGHAKKILGMDIRRNIRERIMIILQEKYLNKELDTFRMQRCKPIMTPSASHFRLSNLQFLK